MRLLATALAASLLTGLPAASGVPALAADPPTCDGQGNCP